MTTQTVPTDGQRLDNAVISLNAVGWTVDVRTPDRVVLSRPKIKYPTVLFLILTVVTLGAFLLIWIPLACCVPRVCRTTLTVVDGRLVQTRKWSYA